MKKIIIATKNAGKASEFKDFFASYNMEAVSLLDFDEEIEDVEETGTTFEENAALKAETIAEQLGETVLADDSGLMIDALDGRPGLYSARYAGEEKSDEANIEKVLKEMEHVPEAERTARFISVLAVAEPGKRTIFKKGYCEGTITFKPRGENGFGYDPIFIPEAYETTMAELDAKEKNSISHRKNAISKLHEWINTL